MAKTALSRIDDAISYIRSNRPGDCISRDAHDAIMNQIAAWQRVTNNNDKTTLGNLLSQDDATHRATWASGRKKVRAAIFLKCVFCFPVAQWQTTANGEKNINGNRTDQYKRALEDAADKAMSEPTRALAMIGALRTDPVGLLGRQKFTLSSSARNGNPAHFGVYMRQGSYRIDGNNSINARVTFSAMNVPATLYATVRDDPGNITGFRSADAGGADMMFTTQFTGCCFCFQISGDGSQIVAAHIDPGGGMGRASDVDGPQVSAAMRANGGFANGNDGTFKAYGRVTDAATYGYPQSAAQMIIIGIKDGGRWRVYAQITHRDDRLEALRIDNI